MKIYKSTIHFIDINDIRYVRFDDGFWEYADCNSEPLFNFEDLEEEFQEVLKVQKDIGMI